jgi:rhamnogalacturonyl hydrolase YesR
MKLQRADGLWGVFADTPEVGPDTGGSAGIAAALGLA